MAHDPHELRPWTLRLPESLRAKIEESAAKSGRSMNAEAVYRLEQSYVKEKRNEENQQLVTLAAQQATSVMIDTITPMLEELRKRK